MNIDRVQDQIIYWLKSHEKEFGLYKKGKSSAMIALDTYNKINSSYELSKDIKFEIEKIISENLNIEFIGDLIQMARNWSLVKNYNICKGQWTYEKITESIKRFFMDHKNNMDSIDRLLCYSLLSLEDCDIKLMLNNAIKELSNVLYWKYELVQDPIYYRKIHNSFHYCTPYILLYNLSKIQAMKSMLTHSDKVVLENVIFDGYENFDKLNLLDAGLLLSSTPIQYQNLVLNVIDKYILRIEKQGFQNIPYYYDNLQFGTFVGAETYTAAVILEALVIAGKFEWKTFIASENSSNNNSVTQNHYLVNINTFHHTKLCRMKMKEHCMAPFLDEGDEIDVSYDFSDIAINDIMVFRHFDGKIMAHRVIDIITKGNKSAIITAADNGGLWGYPVFKRDIVGKVVSIYKHE